MRLINCSTLQLEEFFGDNIPKYAILSHTWGDEEVTFADLKSNQAGDTTHRGYQKIKFTCWQASCDRLKYAWIDTCCIDKSSSSELSEAINSMFAWYENSARCYVYLSDVLKADMNESFSRSRWFTRGWTLQELLAPKDVDFYDRQWNELGTRSEHAQWISEITAINLTALRMREGLRYGNIDFGCFCVAKRMSWASRRETTRTEDMAYCLLGIFDINMPLLYGEGDRSFQRLQEEIIKKSDDNSILAWGLDLKTQHPLGLVPDTVKNQMMYQSFVIPEPILARSPNDFRNCRNLEYGGRSTFPFTMTNVGLQIQLPLVPVSESNDRDQGYGWIGLLNCSLGTNLEFLGIPLSPARFTHDPSENVVRTGILKDHGAYYTVIVGPRAAAKSDLRTVTISKDFERPRVRDYSLGYRQIVVNESSTLQKIGYHVRDGIVDPLVEIVRYNLVWDPERMLLTIHGTNISEDLIAFYFEPQWRGQNSKFTVFMRTASKRAILREGDSFSNDDKLGFYDQLEEQSSKNDTDNLMVRDNEGNLFQVVVTIHEIEVCGRWIFEVNVDAVRHVAGGV